VRKSEVYPHSVLKRSAGNAGKDMLLFSSTAARRPPWLSAFSRHPTPPG